MARRRRGGSRSKKIPLAVVIPLVAPAINAYKLAGGVNQGFVDRLGVYYTGYHPSLGNWDFQRVMPLVLGLGAGVMIHKTLGKFANRYLPKSLPFGL